MENDCCNCRNPKVIVAFIVIVIGLLFVVVGLTIGITTKEFKKDRGPTVSYGDNVSSGPSAKRLISAGNKRGRSILLLYRRNILVV